MATERREFSFPDDHGPHPDYRNEWWYLTGNLDGAAGRRFGFELTIFRFSLTPGRVADEDSAWATNQVYIGHFALTDVATGKFHVFERYSRGAAGLAGAIARPLRIWLDDWSVSAAGADFPWRLQAADGSLAMDLELSPLKPIVLNGDGGLSRKSAERGNASYYYSVPRLEATGTLRLDDEVIPVAGRAWLDREWGSSALSREQAGWDWFALQLSDGSDLMVYRLRRLDGSVDEHSSGTWIDSTGSATRLVRDDVDIVETAYWESTKGGRYPAGWRISVPGQGLSVDVEPVLDDQELVTNVRYWEGAVDVSGRRNDQPVSGRGYVELTGYAND
jgi:predicted secreted hydrolase